MTRGRHPERLSDSGAPRGGHGRNDILKIQEGLATAEAKDLDRGLGAKGDEAPFDHAAVDTPAPDDLAGAAAKIAFEGAGVAYDEADLDPIGKAARPAGRSLLIHRRFAHPLTGVGGASALA